MTQVDGTKWWSKVMTQSDDKNNDTPSDDKRCWHKLIKHNDDTKWWHKVMNQSDKI